MVRENPKSATPPATEAVHVRNLPGYAGLSYGRYAPGSHPHAPITAEVFVFNLLSTCLFTAVFAIYHAAPGLRQPGSIRVSVGNARQAGPWIRFCAWFAHGKDRWKTTTCATAGLEAATREKEALTRGPAGRPPRLHTQHKYG